MRPKLPPSLKRNKMVEARFSSIELEMLRESAHDAGVSMAEFIRRSVLLRPLPKRLSRVSLQTYRELGRIGNNINQLTLAANIAINRGQSPPAAVRDLEALSQLLHATRREIIMADKKYLLRQRSDDDNEFSDGEDDWEAD